LGFRLGFKTNERPGEVFVFVVADGNAELAVLAFLDLDSSGGLHGGRFLFLSIGCQGGEGHGTDYGGKGQKAQNTKHGA